MTAQKARNCSRQLGQIEIHLNSAGLDQTEVALLEIARFYLQTYAVAASHTWILASKAAGKHFGI